MRCSGSDAPWIAVQVRPKMEKTVAQHLEHRGYEYFLPRRRGSGGTPRTAIDAPLFPGYVFCRFDTAVSAPIVTIPGVSRIVNFGGAPACIEEEEIAAIRRALASGQPVLPMTSFLPGTAVSIADGPLRGVRGTVIGIDDTRYLVVSVTLLQRSIAVELHPSWVRAESIAEMHRHGDSRHCLAVAGTV